MTETTQCPKCTSTHLIRLSSQRRKICGCCSAAVPWELEEGQPPLVANNRQVQHKPPTLCSHCGHILTDDERKYLTHTCSQCELAQQETLNETNPQENQSVTEDNLMTRPEEPAPAGVDQTLAERETQYGDYATKAKLIQDMKQVLRAGPNWEVLPADMRESLDMVVHKMGRILTGDYTLHDSWHDIIGYTRLVEAQLKK